MNFYLNLMTMNTGVAELCNIFITIIISFVGAMILAILIFSTDFDKMKKRRLYKKRYKLIKENLDLTTIYSYRYTKIFLEIDENFLKEDYDKVDELLEELKSKIN